MAESVPSVAAFARASVAASIGAAAGSSAAPLPTSCAYATEAASNSATAPGLRDMVDLAFALQGRELPRAHRASLAAALQRVLPWLVESSGMAVHRLNIAAGGGPMALLSGRTRLTLRLPRARLDDAEALSGTTLQVAGHVLRVGAAQRRELLAFGTLYAHFVAADEGITANDELAFLDQVGREMAALGIRGRVICGRHQAQEDGTLGGYGLMLDGLDRDAARRVLEHGIGAHRLWGCGVFVPHRSASAVGQPD